MRSFHGPARRRRFQWSLFSRESRSRMGRAQTLPERRETRRAERRRAGWANGEDRPFPGGARRIVPHVSIPDEGIGHSREGVSRAHSTTGIRKAAGAGRCSRQGHRDSSGQSLLTLQAASFDRMPLRSIFADLMSGWSSSFREIRGLRRLPPAVRRSTAVHPRAR